MNPALQPPAIEIKATKPERQQIGSATMEQNDIIILRERLIDGGLWERRSGELNPALPRVTRSGGIFRR